MNNRTIFISVAAFIGIIFIAAVAMYKSQLPSTIASDLLPALDRIGAAEKGGKLAKVTIVEFFDPA